MLNFFTLFADTMSTEDILQIVAMGVIALTVIVVVALSLANKKQQFNTKAIVAGGIFVALSFALSFIKIKLPYGGSITLASMLPLFLYAYIFGLGRGLLAGIVYGLLQFIQDPFFLSVLQFSLDFILPFAAICVAGIFKKCMSKQGSIVSGVLLFSLLRLLSHIFAGIIFYHQGWIVELPFFGDVSASGAFVYSMLYNLIYMVPETAILLGVAFALVKTNQLSAMEKQFEKQV